METFVVLIRDHAAWGRVALRAGDHGDARERLIQVAALAVAAAESLDRRHRAGVARTPASGGDRE